MNKLKWMDTGKCPECKQDLILHHIKNDKVDEAICTKCKFEYPPQFDKYEKRKKRIGGQDESKTSKKNIKK